MAWKSHFLLPFLFTLGNVGKRENQNIPQGEMYSQGPRKQEAIFVNLLAINLFRIVFLNNHILKFLPFFIWLAYIYCPSVCFICFNFIKFMFVLSLSIILSWFQPSFFWYPSSFFDTKSGLLSLSTFWSFS